EAESGKTAGLIVLGMDYATLRISYDRNGYFIQQTRALKANEGGKEEVLETQRLSSKTAIFRVEVSAPEATCQFSYSEDGQNFKKIGKPFTAKPGKWVGAKIGLFSISSPEAKRGGYADVDWFRISKK
ncbi:MAG: glycoside hydrolase, partial [Bacteroidota bacterium]|nr:glycoside hydrolase [Bacteroidota bacterium]